MNFLLMLYESQLQFKRFCIDKINMEQTNSFPLHKSNQKQIFSILPAFLFQTSSTLNNSPIKAPQQKIQKQKQSISQTNCKVEDKQITKKTKGQIKSNLQGDEQQNQQKGKQQKGQTNLQCQNKPKSPHAKSEQQFSKKMKRMYKFPASIPQALVHQRANRTGFKSKESQSQQNKMKHVDTLICPCCQNFVNTVKLPLCYGTYPVDSRQKDSFMIQNGDALFFCFIKLVITYLSLRFVTLDAYNLYTNYTGGYCEMQIEQGVKGLCTNWYVSILSSYNNKQAEDQSFIFWLDLISLINTIITIAFFLYGRIKLSEFHQKLEKWDLSEDDYTILVQDIPPIPFIRNDTLIKDINQEYTQFVRRYFAKKIKIWLNRFYSYEKDQIQSAIDKQFYSTFQKIKQNSMSDSDIVPKVNLCYDLSQLQNLVIIRQKLIQNFLQEQANNLIVQSSIFGDQHQRLYIAHLPLQIQIINQHYVKLCQKLSQTTDLSSFIASPNTTKNMNIITQRNNKIQKSALCDKQQNNTVNQLKISRFIGKAFVSFRYQHYKSYILDQFQTNRDYFKINGNTVQLMISDAQKPNDICWQNLKYSNQYRQRHKIYSYLLLFLIFLISTGIMFLLRYWQSDMTNNKKNMSWLIELLIYSIALWSFLINKFLDWIINITIINEKHKTKTQQLSYIIVQNIIAKFFNTSVIYALIFFVNINKVNPLSQNGLVNILFSLVSQFAVINIVYEIIQPLNLLNQCFFNRQYFSKTQGKVHLFQIKLNKILQQPSFNFANAYSYYLQMIFICSFYGYLVPITTPILIIAFTCQYWVDKYNLFRRFSSPIDNGFSLTQIVWRFFEMSLVLFVLGHFIWGITFSQQLKAVNMILNSFNVTIAVLYVAIVVFNPYWLQKMLKSCITHSEFQTQTYQQAYQSFEKTYRAQNPATSFVNQTRKQVVANNVSIMLIQKFFDKDQKIKSDLYVPEDDEKLTKIYNKPNQFTGEFTTLLCYC